MGSAECSRDILDTLATEPHITARRRVEDMLEGALVSSGGIGKWREKLVHIEWTQNYGRVKDYYSLRAEVLRLNAWLEERNTTR